MNRLYLLPVPIEESWFEDFRQIVDTYSMAPMDAVIASAIEEVIVGRPNGERTYYQEGVLESVFQTFDETLEADITYAANPFLSDKARTQFNDHVMALSDTLLSYYERYRLHLPADINDAIWPAWMQYDTLCIEIRGGVPCQTLRQYRFKPAASFSLPRKS